MDETVVNKVIELYAFRIPENEIAKKVGITKMEVIDILTKNIKDNK